MQKYIHIYILTQHGVWRKKEDILREEEKGLRGGKRKGHGRSMAALPRNARFLLAHRPKPSRNVGRAIRSMITANAPERFQNHRQQI